MMPGNPSLTPHQVRDRSDFVDQLVENLQPVRPLSAHWSSAAMLGLALVGFAAVAAVLGVRADLVAGQPNPVVLLRGGMLLVLGLVTTASAFALARPAVGRQDRSWAGATAMAASVPAAALLFALLDPAAALRAVWWSSAINCLFVSLSAALGFGAIIVAQLRRGAPVQLGRAGWVTGIAAGSLGVLVYSIHCPANHIAYIGLWYTLPIAISAVSARLIVPRLVRW